MSDLSYSLTLMETLIAICALLLSLTSLLWQFFTHWMNGDRVIVRLGTSIPVGPVNLPVCRTITAMNRGRIAVTVSGIGLDVRDGRHAHVSSHLVGAISDRLPMRLEPGSSASWAFPVEIDEEVLRDHPRRRAVVSLGTGRRRYSSR